MGPGRGRCGRRRVCSTRPVQRLAGVLLLLALACMPPAAAGAVDITVVVGFADTFRPGHWTPLGVTVTNRGASLFGEVEVDVTGGDALHGRQFLTSHRRNLDLHQGTRKTFQFVVRPQGLSRPLVIRVRSDGREVARAEVDLRGRFIAERLLLVLSRDANLDYLNESSGASLKVAYPHPELLPAHWRGYDAVAAVVVHGVSLERLGASQFDALHKWIAQGGILAVSGGSDYALLRGPRLSALLPAEPAGMTRLAPDVLRSAFSASLDVSRPVHVNRLDAVRGHVRLGAGTVPLIVERALGLGRVLYLAFDVSAHPFDRWDGMRALWLDSLRLPAAGGVPLAADEPKLESALPSPLSSLVAAGSPNFPAAATMFFFLALYLGLLLAAYLLPQRAAWTRWQALARAWGAPLLFAPVAWLLFGPGTREATAVTMAVIEPLPGSIYARLGLDLGVYSTRGGPQRLEYRGAEPVLFPTRRAQRDGNAEDWVFGEGPRRFVEPLDHRRYVLHALEGEDVIAFHVEASVDDEATGPRLVLANDSGRDLRDLWLLFDGYAYEVGSIAAGAKVERRLARTRGVELNEAAWRRVLSRDRAHLAAPARIVLDRRTQATGGSGYPTRGRALLIADTASPLQPAGASSGRPRQERALVAFEVAARP